MKTKIIRVEIAAATPMFSSIYSFKRETITFIGQNSDFRF